MEKDGSRCFRPRSFFKDDRLEIDAGCYVLNPDFVESFSQCDSSKGFFSEDGGFPTRFQVLILERDFVSVEMDFHPGR